jgi:hypothetical protein
MKYSNSLARGQINDGDALAVQKELCPHCHQPLSLPPPRKSKNKHLWVDAVALLERTQALELARQAVQWAEKPLLSKKSKPGPKPIYTDGTVLVTFLVAKLWHLSYEEMLAWLHNWPRLAYALGYAANPKTGQLQIISLGSYSKRLRALSLTVYFAFFVLLVRQLLRAGLLAGRDLIIDSTILRAWSLQDAYCAVSYKYKDVNKRFGVKVHTVIDRVSGLPIILALSPANPNDGPFALPLLKAAVQLYGLNLQIVRGDAAYHCAALYAWVVKQMGAIWAVDYNLRRRGKKQLAYRVQMKAWRAFMRPRATIERFFAWAKRYYKLKYFKVQGQAAIGRHVLAVYIAMLLVGRVAWQAKRVDLMRSPSRVLAYFDA